MKHKNPKKLYYNPLFILFPREKLNYIKSWNKSCNISKGYIVCNSLYVCTVMSKKYYINFNVFRHFIFLLMLSYLDSTFFGNVTVFKNQILK